MICPKCGAQVDDKENVCPYCKEELKAQEPQTEEAKAEQVGQTDEQTAEEKAGPVVTEQAEKPAKKEKKSIKLDLKNPKTVITCIAAVVAVVIFMAAMFGVVSLAKKTVGPENVAEDYIEAMAEGNIRKALRKTAPWVLRNIAEMLDLNENASAGRIASEYEKEMGDFGLGGKIVIEEVRLCSYTDNAIGEALDELDVFYDYDITYKEVKAITEIAVVEADAYIKVLGEKEYVSFEVYCARLDGDWVVINFESNY